MLTERHPLPNLGLRPGGFVVRVGDVVLPAAHSFELKGEDQLLEDLSGVF